MCNKEIHQPRPHGHMSLLKKGETYGRGDEVGDS